VKNYFEGVNLMNSMSLPSVFMIGWEFPPHNSGGLGTACEGLTKALSNEGIYQVFVLPKKIPVSASFVEIAFPNSPFLKQVHVNMQLNPYCRPPKEYAWYLNRKNYSWNPLIDDVYSYAETITHIVGNYDHDVIHGHDWMTYPASIAASKISKKPVVLHVHSTEFDRTLNGAVDPVISDIEREGLYAAEKVIAVSEYTKGIVCERYGVKESKVDVVHNGIDLTERGKFGISDEEIKMFAAGKKVIIFVGRLTCQKGPDYFVRVASDIAKAVPEALFVIAGSGDMYEQIVMQSAGHRLTGKLLYAGFLRDRQKELLYKRADLFIMPSVSEPFGIVALEAASYNTPIIISKQSGVREVMPSALVADFWDCEKISNMAISVLNHNDYRNQLSWNGARDVENVTWGKAAKKCINVYRSLI
jgi:glycogen(starch) synthase